MRNHPTVKQYRVALSVIDTTVHQLMDEFGGDTTLRQTALLTSIMRAASNGQPLEMRELSIDLQADRRRISRDIAILSRFGDKDDPPMIQLQPSTSDRRSKLVGLTQTGIRGACRLGSSMRQLAYQSRERIEQLFA